MKDERSAILTNFSSSRNKRQHRHSPPMNIKEKTTGITKAAPFAGSPDTIESVAPRMRLPG